jgi:phosphoglycerate kinase
MTKFQINIIMINFKETNFSGKRVVMRVDFNVPLNAEFQVTDDTRIEGAKATIAKVLKDGGSVVLMSHLGRPKGGPENKYSLKHIIPALQVYFPDVKINFADDCVSEEAFSMSSSLKTGEILCLKT